MSSLAHVGARLALLALVAAACSGGAVTTRPDNGLVVATNSTDMGFVEAKPAPARPRGHSREPTLREARVIRELMSSAERVRGLRFERPVPVLVQDRERITGYVETQIEEDELVKAHVVYTALGLLEQDADVRGMLLRLMGEQIVGYYDAQEKRLAVRDDVMRAFARQRGSEDEESDDLTEARIVLVHELVHALQDQNLGLSRHIELERDTDADNAFHALIEGDATLAMIGFALEHEEIPLHRLTANPAQVRSFSDLVRHSPLAGSELERAPAIVRVPLLSAYVDGLAFSASLHGAGGWAAVDRAHTAPPVSTEQVLHPERLSQPDLPERITLPELAEITTSGYALVREDTLGELEMRIYFGQTGSEDGARAAAEGWDGDRLRVYQKRGLASVVVWVSMWDSERDAEEAERAAVAVHAAQEPQARVLAEVTRRGRALLILRGLPEPLRRNVSAAFSDTGLAPPLESAPRPR